MQFSIIILMLIARKLTFEYDQMRVYLVYLSLVMDRKSRVLTGSRFSRSCYALERVSDRFISLPLRYFTMIEVIPLGTDGLVSFSVAALA